MLISLCRHLQIQCDPNLVNCHFCTLLQLFPPIRAWKWKKLLKFSCSGEMWNWLVCRSAHTHKASENENIPGSFKETKFFCHKQARMMKKTDNFSVWNDIYFSNDIDTINNCFPVLPLFPPGSWCCWCRDQGPRRRNRCLWWVNTSLWVCGEVSTARIEREHSAAVVSSALPGVFPLLLAASCWTLANIPRPFWNTTTSVSHLICAWSCSVESQFPETSFPSEERACTICHYFCGNIWCKLCSFLQTRT